MTAMAKGLGTTCSIEMARRSGECHTAAKCWDVRRDQLQPPALPGCSWRHRFSPSVGKLGNTPCRVLFGALGRGWGKVKVKSHRPGLIYRAWTRRPRLSYTPWTCFWLLVFHNPQQHSKRSPPETRLPLAHTSRCAPHGRRSELQLDGHRSPHTISQHA